MPVCWNTILIHSVSALNGGEETENLLRLHPETVPLLHCVLLRVFLLWRNGRVQERVPAAHPAVLSPGLRLPGPFRLYVVFGLHSFFPRDWVLAEATGDQMDTFHRCCHPYRGFPVRHCGSQCLARSRCSRCWRRWTGLFGRRNEHVGHHAVHVPQGRDDESPALLLRIRSHCGSHSHRRH